MLHTTASSRRRLCTFQSSVSFASVVPKQYSIRPSVYRNPWPNNVYNHLRPQHRPFTIKAMSSSSSTSHPSSRTESASLQARPRPPPRPTHVLETALQVKDVVASTKFYKDLLGIEPDLDTPRMSTFALGVTTLLLFQLGATAADSALPDSRGVIPGHGPSDDILSLLVTPVGESTTSTTTTTTTTTTPRPRPRPSPSPSHLKQHFCLAVPTRADVAKWEEWFAQTGVQVTGTVDWPRGGRSVYFADLDANVGEIASRGVWGHY